MDLLGKAEAMWLVLDVHKANADVIYRVLFPDSRFRLPDAYPGTQFANLRARATQERQRRLDSDVHADDDGELVFFLSLSLPMQTT